MYKSVSLMRLAKASNNNAAKLAAVAATGIFGKLAKQLVHDLVKYNLNVSYGKFGNRR